MGFYRCMPDGSVSPSFNKQGFYRCYPAVSGGGEDVWLRYFNVIELGQRTNYYNEIVFYYDSYSSTGGTIIQHSGKLTSMEAVGNKLYFNTAARSGSSIYLNSDCSKTFDGMSRILSSDWDNLVNFFNFSLIEDGSYMFRNCRRFNQPLNLPNLTNGSYMFAYSDNFNTTLNLPNLTNGSYMFYYSDNFNQPLNLPNLTNGSYMFAYCNNFNQSVIIPNTVLNCANMFDYSINMASNIYINYNSSFTRSKFTAFIRARNNSKRINIFCKNLYILNGTGSGVSITGAAMTWTTITNGYYNSTYNIYLYNNYSG